MAKIAYGLYKGKFLNAVSVGFVPLRWEDGSQEDGYSRKYLEQELLEVSAVGIPANPSALALGLKSGAIQKSDLHDLSDLIHLTLDRSADFQSAVSPISNRLPGHQPSTNHNQLVRMAKQLHSLLKS